MTERKIMYTMVQFSVVAHKIAKETPRTLYILHQNPIYGNTHREYRKKDDGMPCIDSFIGFDLTKEQILEIVQKHINDVQESLHKSVESLKLL